MHIDCYGRVSSRQIDVEGAGDQSKVVSATFKTCGKLPRDRGNGPQTADDEWWDEVRCRSRIIEIISQREISRVVTPTAGRDDIVRRQRKARMRADYEESTYKSVVV